VSSDEELPDISSIPAPPAGASFHLKKIERISIPHPFVIGPRHVTFASDHRSGRLTKEAIKASGAPCEWKGCRLGIDEHESQVTLFISVPQNDDLNAVDGLHAYLLSVKDRCVELGIDGFAFPKGA